MYMYSVYNESHTSSMPRTTTQNVKAESLNLRVDPALKAEFVAASEAENKPVAEILRKFMRAYVEHAKRNKFAAEARRKSQLLASFSDEAEVFRWMQGVSDSEGWK